MAQLIKLANMAGVMHKADHAYSIQSTWWLYWLATNVPFIACAINLPFILYPLFGIVEFLVLYLIVWFNWRNNTYFLILIITTKHK